MAVVFSDPFTRADSTNLGANWTEFSGDWSILSNQLRGPSTAGPANVHLAETTTSAHAAIADCRVTVKRVAGTSFDGGPVARKVSGADSCYYLDVNGTNIMEVYRRVAGVDTSLGQRNQTHANGDTFGLEVSGTGATVTLKVYRNGTQVGADISDANAARIVTAGRCGVAQWSGSADWDDFSVDDLAPATTLEQEGFRVRNDDGSETTATWVAAQDTNVTVPLGSVIRPRFIVNATGDPASQAYQCDYRVTPISTGVTGAWKRARPSP